MEHNVYLCGWKQSPEGFCLWMTTKPLVRVEAPTCLLAEERLLDAILAQGGAMHSVLEFDPPLPKSERELKYSRPELYLICGDDRFETDIPWEAEKEEQFSWLDAFFERPVCRMCGGASSARSERPLRLTYAPRGGDGAFGHFGSGGATSVEIVSEEFLALLSSEERRGLVTRPVLQSGGRRRFHELVGPGGPEFVAVANLPVSGWRCSGCGRSRFGYWIDGFAIQNFIAAADLPESLPGVFTVGRPPEVRLCVTGERWRELVGRRGVRGFVSRALGVVSYRELVRRPQLPGLVKD